MCQDSISWGEKEQVPERKLFWLRDLSFCDYFWRRGGCG